MVAGLAEGVLGLVDGVDDQLRGVLVGQPVEDSVAVVAGRHDPGQPQLRQMLRHRGWRLVDRDRDRVHRELTSLQGEHDSNSRGVGQHAEHLDSQLDELSVDKVAQLRDRLHRLHIRVHTQILDKVLSWVNRSWLVSAR
jgi:hypothetical protein